MMRMSQSLAQVIQQLGMSAFDVAGLCSSNLITIDTKKCDHGTGADQREGLGVAIPTMTAVS